ncbi:hypothetical protein [Nesterenkonia populi]
MVRAGTEAEDPQQLRHIMVAELDTVAQGCRRLQLDTAAAFEAEMLTQIRTSLMLSDRLLLTDVMLLDSPFFTTYTPEKLAHSLGLVEHQLPITVLSRHSTLAEALQVRIEDSTFLWQLQRTSVEADWQTSSIRAAWDAWIHAADAGRIRFAQQTAQPAPDEPFVHAEPPVGLQFTTEVGQNLLAEAQQATKRSTVFDGHQEATSSPTLTAEEQQECDNVRDWWNYEYLRRIAQIHGANWAAFGERPDFMEPVTTRDSAQLPVSARLITHMGTQTASRFGLAYHRSAEQRAKFLERPSRRRLKNVSYAATADATPDTPLVTGLWALLKVVGFVLVIIATLLSFEVQDNLVPWIQDSLNLGGDPAVDIHWGWMALFGVVGTILSAYPFQEHREWWKLRDTDGDALVEIWKTA